MANPDNRIRVLIADDFELLRDVIRLYLERSEDMAVIDEAPELSDAMKSALQARPDIIIMNDYLPPIDSAHASALFRKQGIKSAILIISMKLEPALIQRSFLKGANGVMHKEEIDDCLIEAIRHVHQGERYLSPRARAASIRIPG
jgi:DNA-binding NarL/FixJ family response regulator